MAPRRTEIEPADIKPVLADTFILEKDVRDEAIFRLAGTRLCATYGRELKGFAFASLWNERDHKIVEKLAETAFRKQSVAIVAFLGISQKGRSNPFELIVLPLEGGNDNPRVLGSLIPMDVPFWLGADPIVENRVQTLRILDPEREPLFLKNRPEMPVPPIYSDPDRRVGDTVSTGRGERRIRHLLVIEGGRDS